MPSYKHKLPLIALGAASLLSVSAQAHEAGDWVLRAGAAIVSPNDSSSIIQPPVVSPGGQISIDDDTQLGLTAVYMFTDNWGIEVLAATPFKHTVSFAGDLEGLGSLAKVEHLPPTVSAQYYFNSSNKFIPYLGIGINYTLILDAEATANGEAILDTLPTGGDYTIDADDSIGLAVQAGFDYQLNERFILNAAVWYMDIDTTVEVSHAIKVDLEIDPWVYMIGIGYKF